MFIPDVHIYKFKKNYNRFKLIQLNREKYMKRTKNDLFETLKMLSQVLDNKQYNKTVQVISQLFMGHKYELWDEGVSYLRSCASNIFRETEKKTAERINKEFDQQYDVFGFNEHIRMCQLRENHKIKLKFYKFLLNNTSAPEVTKGVSKEAELIKKKMKNKISADKPAALLDNNEIIYLLKGGKKDEE